VGPQIHEGRRVAGGGAVRQIRRLRDEPQQHRCLLPRESGAWLCHRRLLGRVLDQLGPDRLGQWQGVDRRVAVGPELLELRTVMPIALFIRPGRGNLDRLVVRAEGPGRLVAAAGEHQAIPPGVGHDPELGVYDALALAHQTDPDLQKPSIRHPGQHLEALTTQGLLEGRQPLEKALLQGAKVAALEDRQHVVPLELLVGDEADRGQSALAPPGPTIRDPPDQTREPPSGGGEHGAREVRAAAVIPHGPG